MQILRVFLALFPFSVIALAIPLNPTEAGLSRRTFNYSPDLGPRELEEFTDDIQAKYGREEFTDDIQAKYGREEFTDDIQAKYGREEFTDDIQAKYGREEFTDDIQAKYGRGM
ncbi:hypothetical protein BYT27DRAFT_7251134 [Phlegmacium glaucopus]|nr:hypothetical protein BYT27DRAFT_7251134 [Phlegmacium glaucopus]